MRVKRLLVNVLAGVLTVGVYLSPPAFMLTTAACASAPVNLSPPARAAWYGTRVIKDLDLLRDTAIDANATMPPLVSTATTRKVVQFHESAITVVHASPNGWKSAVSTGLDELQKDLSAEERKTLAPYLLLVRTVLQEVS